jgi:hypothetical protein
VDALERPSQGLNAPMFARERRRSIVVLSSILCAIERHLRVKPTSTAALFWKFLVFRVLVTPCCIRIQPYDFRVSRTLLDSINRPVNTEKHTLFLEKNLQLSRKRFSGFIPFLYFLFYFMKMISINNMCKNLLVGLD